MMLQLYCLNSLVSKGIAPEGFNHTNIAMIPKIKNATIMSHYMVISLCNVVYKIASKMVTIWFKQIMPTIIFQSQSVFVLGRLISDNIITAFEFNHFLKNKLMRNKGHFSLKMHMSKAYDRVEWTFIEKMLLQLGFDVKFINVLMRCVSSASFSILINGDPVGSFRPCRGLCQEDTLSPYLFIICVEGFSSLFQRVKRNGSFPGIAVSRGTLCISSFFFADDSVIFGDAIPNRASKIRCILNAYDRVGFREKNNLNKSVVVFNKNTTPEAREVVTNILSVTGGEA